MCFMASLMNIVKYMVCEKEILASQKDIKGGEGVLDPRVESSNLSFYFLFNPSPTLPTPKC